MTATTSQIENNQWLIDLFAQCEETEVECTAPVEIVPVTKAASCPRCSGSGRLSYYSHIKGGECFKCHGTGKKS